MKRTAAALFVGAALVVLSLTGCSKKQSADIPGANMASLGGNSGVTAGIRWSIPKRWTDGGQKPMRVATYTVSASEGDPEGGECAVFYFGSNQGGTVDQNIARWVSQFETSGMPAQAAKTIDGMKVTLVQVAGAYLAPAGPQMESTGKKENYRLLGAIVEGPEGMVFFKFTGPAKTIGEAEGEFNAMIASLAKVS
ncbi:MAG TPA: hypothetical protein VMM80_00405 [Bacteroidota bacterium]|nr:hypothetical protein [Bacteroidota bacterium]